ncbi:hypothetical protein PITCH_A300003 [uncultured Desulfobacterium sp.]|uniref:Uncharacterized protein n=1 Tax=uncultured Desulfobacterium sp. TaxID=201089 RepID=A0A445MYW6_9BACT|nr:hypothetical protein PITCH_A300003 [uncultured Desulfobacterium sp.]
MISSILFSFKKLPEEWIEFYGAHGRVVNFIDLKIYWRLVLKERITISRFRLITGESKVLLIN